MEGFFGQQINNSPYRVLYISPRTVTECFGVQQVLSPIDQNDECGRVYKCVRRCACVWRSGGFDIIRLTTVKETSIAYNLWSVRIFFITSSCLLTQAWLNVFVHVLLSLKCNSSFWMKDSEEWRKNPLSKWVFHYLALLL